jgi:hypothetical protein
MLAVANPLCQRIWQRRTNSWYVFDDGSTGTMSSLSATVSRRQPALEAWE